MGRVHAKAARAAGGRLVGIADSVRPLAEALAGDLAFRTVFQGSEDLIADPQVEVVHVCVPNHAHPRLVAEAIKAGKHVVCEKPLATTADEAREARGARRRCRCRRVGAVRLPVLPDRPRDP